MSTKNNITLAGVLFLSAGALTLVEGICSRRASNLFLGLCFVGIGLLYLKRRKRNPA